MPAKNREKGRQSNEPWSRLSDAELLQWRLCDLRLSVSGSSLAADIDDLYRSLERRGIRFKPHVWLSTEWFSPDGIPGIAVPFFAAHPRLARLEQRMKGEAEGGNRRWRRRILAHEAGHALDTAYGLRRRADWRAVFGRASKPYPVNYAVRPASRRFVLHLGHWYAQSHPTEDFAETFAVWLQPKSRWRRDYDGWPALDKLEYVDVLMQELAGRPPRNAKRSVVASVAQNKRSLREHYRRARPQENAAERRYDAWLRRAFGRRPSREGAISASRFLGEIGPAIRKAVMRDTGAGPYLFDHAANTLRRRARELDLVLRDHRGEARRKAIRLHAQVIRDLLRRNRERYVL